MCIPPPLQVTSLNVSTSIPAGHQVDTERVRLAKHYSCDWRRSRGDRPEVCGGIAADWQGGGGGGGVLLATTGAATGDAGGLGRCQFIYLLLFIFFILTDYELLSHYYNLNAFIVCHPRY